MPDVAGVFGCNDISRSVLIISWLRDSLFFEDPANSRCPQVQARPGKGVGDSYLSHGGAQGFEALNEVAHEIGIPVDWPENLEQGARPALIEAGRPGSNGRRRDPEGVRSLIQRPGPGGAQLENGHSLEGAITGPAMGSDAINPGVFDSNFLTKKRALLYQALILCRQPHAAANMASSHPSSMDDGEMGKGDCMQDRRLHMTVPVPGEGNTRVSLFHGHNGLRKESLLLDLGGYHKCCIIKRFWPGGKTTNSLDQDRDWSVSLEKRVN